MVKLLTLKVEQREETGKRRNRRLRESGKIPAVLYGHKQANVMLSVATEEVEAAMRHGSRFVVLSGAVSERAFIKDCQWDTWGKMILHVDFTRVSEHERVQLSVPLDLRGEAPGTKDGGVVKQHLYNIEIESEPAFAPERIGVNINNLEFNQYIHVSDLVLPEGVTTMIDGETLVVECTEPVVAAEESAEASAEGTAEPEVIGRKKSEEEEE